MNVLKAAYNSSIPEPEDIHMCKWHSNPLFKGSYSNFLPHTYLNGFMNLTSNISKIYFAGEGYEPNYNGYVHGGYINGRDVGE